eukprot:Phypoly_transcript_09053.p1 GENE.Phypoly_transcript_09053~~Phypoly_transcript_09053.p1  ORF type:complete len:477 (-),score=74.61 Phypoly_transcript_09053:15-1313(-)
MALVVALAGMYATKSPIRTDPTAPGPGWSLQNVVRGRIERIEWLPNKEFTQDLVRLGEPTILYNTMTTQWAAKRLWKDPDYLSNHVDLQQMNGVETCVNSTFFFIEEKAALAKHKGINLTTNYHKINITSKDFFKLIYDPEEKNYYYWYGKVGRDLAKDVTPFSNLWLTPQDQNQFGLYLWLSGKGTRPPIHIDSDHNFYVHISGRKRFILFPPTEWKNLYMYPRLHPQFHKAQVEFEHPDLARFPNYANAKGYEALLEPGDVMYVPPYWWHHVESITPCVSLASWSQGPIARLMKPVYERELAFENLKDPKQRLVAVRLHIEILLKTIFRGDEAKRYLDAVVAYRWEPLKHLFVDTPSYTDTSFCDAKGVTLTSRVIRHTEQEAEFSVQSFEQLFPFALREIDIADFIETIASDAVGAANVYTFLSRCIVL